MAADKVLQVTGAAPRNNKESYLATQFAKAGKKADTAAYEDDSTTTPVAGDSLKALQVMAQELLEKTKAVEDAALALQTAVDALVDVQEHRLPDLMEAHGLTQFVFKDPTGKTTTIKLDDKWRVTMPPMRDQEGNFFPENEQARRDICQWFRDLGKGAIVRKELKVPMGLVSDELALEVMSLVKEKYPDLDPGLVEDIHQKTLEAAVRRMKEAGDEVHEKIVCKPVRKAMPVKSRK